ncbi:MAG: hypothetical protein WBA43_21565 [Elainellaceae cyanobacterium]
MLTARAIPGIAFRVETPTTVSLPRMDIAAFVGFAQRGPVHLPVVVESYPEFVNLFGGLYPLAWDGEHGLWQTACLAPAVQAFFTQGGRRCWVVRVADESQAQTNQFLLPGLLQTDGTSYSPVYAQARSLGSWSDTIQVQTECLFQSLAFATTTIQPGTPFPLSLSIPLHQLLQHGDVIQLDFTDHRHRAYVVLRQGSLPTTQHVITMTTTVQPDDVVWFMAAQDSISGLLESPRGVGLPVLVKVIPQGNRWILTQNVAPLVKLWFFLLSRGLDWMSLLLLLAIAFPVYEPGDWLCLRTSNNRPVWLMLETLEAQAFILQEVWMEGYESLGGLTLARVQHVQLALRVQEPGDVEYRLENLACHASHARFLGHLPTDQQLFSTQVQQTPVPGPPAFQTLWDTVMSPRSPIALELPNTTMVIPLGVRSPKRGALPTTAQPLVRDGLVPASDDEPTLNGDDWSAFLPTIFLDPFLRTLQQRSLLSEASDRLYLQNQPLTGLHALLPLEEVSMIVLTDAAHPGWQLSATETLDVPLPQPIPPSDPCATSGPFQACQPEPTAHPSETLSQPATPATRWLLLPSQHYNATGLLEIQQAVARLAAARGDWVALLGLPKHYRSADVQTHQRLLLTAIQREGETTDSYMALYHPWLISRAETGSLIHSHPAGAIAGVMAARSLRRGAWIAPANEPLRGVLATVPSLSPADEQGLYTAGINPIRQSPQGFVPWGNFTQSMDADLIHLNVRRLLILVRRLALRDGQNLVFAPHSPAVQRRVQYQFEQILHRLFDLGAFAGSTPDEAYRVVLDDTLNRRSQVEQGQLRVDLRVAPSQPMTFIIVRLVQRDADPITVQEVWPYGR